MELLIPSAAAVVEDSWVWIELMKIAFHWYPPIPGGAPGNGGGSCSGGTSAFTCFSTVFATPSAVAYTR